MYCLTDYSLITSGRCDIEGQVFTKCLRQCVPTCATLLQNCSVNFTDCQEGCECPSGTVLDEIQNKCVPIFKCSKTKMSYL